MSDATKARLSSIINEMTALRAEFEGKEWPAEKAARFQELATQGESVKRMIETEEKADQLKQWMDASAGSVVKAGFAGEALPHDGTIDGVFSDQSGALYALDGVGEEKIKVLKSGAYKDAYNQYLRSQVRGGMASIKGDAMKVLNEGTDTAGGFWVPPDYRQELVKKIATMTAVRPNAYAFTTGSDVASFPKATYTTDDKYTSGARLTWTGALISTAISETTNPIAGRENIPVHTALATIALTRSQMEDNSFDLLGYVTMILSEAFGLGEEDAFINGTGSGQPQGFLNHPQATVATASGGMAVLSGASAALAWGVGTAGTATTTGVVGTETALPPQYEAGAKWLANKNTYNALRALSDNQLRPLWNVNDQWPNMANGNAASIMGHPILKSQFMPDISATTYPLFLGDLSGYFIADRVGLSIVVDESIGRLKDIVYVVARKRVGGQLVHYWKTKLMKSNNS
jgi:HK97 family phage major capsid protein